jgi:hypothetical protein
MKLKEIANNQAELFDSLTGGSVLFSYDTPVAAILPSGRALKTSEFYSATTTKHVNKWLTVFDNVETVDQDFINNLANQAYRSSLNLVWA